MKNKHLVDQLLLATVLFWVPTLGFAHGGGVEENIKTGDPINRTTLDATKYGLWETVIPTVGDITNSTLLGVQAVHTVLLPSGKILIVNGSSNRSWGATVDNAKQYTALSDTQKGLIDGRCGNIMHTSPKCRANDNTSCKLHPNCRPYGTASINPLIIKELVTQSYNGGATASSKDTIYQDLINNNAILDLFTDNKVGFYRIPSPPLHSRQFSILREDTGTLVPAYEGEAGLINDLFCSGHLHLPDGKVLFVGGIQYYHGPYLGSKYSYLFDWEKEMMLDRRETSRGRPPAYSNELYDLWTFAGFMSDGHWYSNLVPLADGRLVVFSGLSGTLKKGPHHWLRPTSLQGASWVSPVIEIFDPESLSDPWRSIDVGGLSYTNSPFNTPLDPNTEIKDSFVLYPRNYALADGRIFMSDGTEKFSGANKNSYLITISGSRNEPTVSFEHGPQRKSVVQQYGSTVVDPNSGNILSLAGQIGPPKGQSGSLNNAHGPEQQPGIRVTADLEVYTPETDGIGAWTIQKDFLGKHPSDARMNHQFVILPSKQLLVINGSNYGYHRPTHAPILLDPVYKGGEFSGKYKKTRMNEASQGRLYHSNALLLPDARVLAIGSNPAMALYYPPSKVAASDPFSQVNTGRMPEPDLARIPDPVHFGDPNPNVNINVYPATNNDLVNIGKGEYRAPAESWIAEIFSPPYLFTPGPRPKITDIVKFNYLGSDPGSTTSVSFEKNTSETVKKTFYKIDYSTDNGTNSQSPNHTYQVSVEDLPTHCNPFEGSLVLIKLGSSTHGWDSGQRLIDLKFRSPGLTVDQVAEFDSTTTRRGDNTPYPASNTGKLVFVAPRNGPTTPPGYYMMFYINCDGKPSMAKMINLSMSI